MPKTLFLLFFLSNLHGIITSATASSINAGLAQTIDYAEKTYEAEKFIGPDSLHGNHLGELNINRQIEPRKIDNRNFGPESSAAVSVCLNSFVTAPFFENFDGSSWVSGTGATNTSSQIDPCWSRPNGNAPNFGPTIGSTQSTSTGPNQDVSGSGKYIYSERSGVFSAVTGEITSPSIILPTGLQNPQFKFSYHMYGQDITSLELRLSVNGGTFTNALTISGEQQTSNSAPWREDSVDLSSYIGDTLSFKFLSLATSFRGDIAVDEVSVDGNLIPCAPISNLNLANPTTSSIDVSWTSSNTNGITNIAYYEASAGAGTALTVSGINSPFTLSNLNAGTAYVVSVFDSCGSIIGNAVNDTLATLTCPTVTAAFNSTASFLSVNFTSTANNADSIQWDFAGLGSSNLSNPSFIFPVAGTYTITLRAFNDCGNSDTIIQNLILCDTLQAAFTFNRVGDSLFFSAANSTNATGYIWDLDEGISSSVLAPVVKYANTGQKNITLRVYNNCGDTATVSQSVEYCDLPTANWTYTILPPINSGLRIQFDGSSSTGAVSYAWDFGDGNSATGAQPIHIYSTPNLLYWVELVVTNSCGDTNLRQFRLNQLSRAELPLSSAITLFPNPASEGVYLEWDANEIAPESLSIFSLNGVLQKQTRLDNKTGEQLIALEGLSKGLYIIRVKHSQGIEQLKLRVQK